MLELAGCFGPLFPSFLGDAQAVLDGRDQRAVGLGDGLDVEHPAFYLLAGLDIRLAQILGVGTQQVIGQVRGCGHRLGRVARAVDGQRLCELLAP